MTDTPADFTAAAEQRAAHLLRSGTICIALCALLTLSLPVGAMSLFNGAWMAAIAASMLGLYARIVAPADSPSRATGLILGLVGLVLALPLGAMANANNQYLDTPTQAQ